MVKKPYLLPIVDGDYNFIKYYLSDSERTQFLSLGKPYFKDKAKEWFRNRIIHWEKNNFGTFKILKKIGMNPDNKFDCYPSGVDPYSINKNEFE